MPLTDQSDLFASVHEDGFNRLVGHVMRKRPSLFNYATEWVAADWRERLCKAPEVAPEVLRRSNPVVTVEPALPLLGTGGLYGLNFAAQLVELRLDLHPSSTALPPQLGGRLAEQHFALYGRMCAGLGCPGGRSLEQFPPPPQPVLHVPGDKRGNDHDTPPPPPSDRVVVLPTDLLTCCCMELYVVGHVQTSGRPGAEVLELKLDGLELVDIAPECLEANLECYLRLLVHYVILPRLRIALPMIFLDVIGGLRFSASTSVPNNPAIEDDQVKIYVDLEVGP